jgi:hypothetical protein
LVGLSQIFYTIFSLKVRSFWNSYTTISFWNTGNTTRSWRFSLARGLYRVRWLPVFGIVLNLSTNKTFASRIYRVRPVPLGLSVDARPTSVTGSQAHVVLCRAFKLFVSSSAFGIRITKRVMLPTIVIVRRTHTPVELYFFRSP